MNSRERVLTALAKGQPDRVPYCELGIDPALAMQLMGWERLDDSASSHDTACAETNLYSIREAVEIAEELGLDNVSYTLRAPVYAERHVSADGRAFYGRGMIRSEDDLAILQLPDPTDDALFAEAEAFLSQKGDYAAFFVTRLGIFSAVLSMGIETFGLALYDNRAFIEAVLDIYYDWAEIVAERACQMGFDVFVSTDDLAHKSGPFFSPHVFRELIWPRHRRVAQKITLPWFMHSDGDLTLLLDDIVGLGVAGLHPIEKGAMDISAVKQAYGDRLCLLGNVDLNLLGRGTPEEVEREVQELIRTVGPSGGYIVTSGNSLTSYLKPKNVRALARAVKEYGQYPLSGG